MNNKEELKPCPFCGGEAVLWSPSIYDYRIGCKDDCIPCKIEVYNEDEQDCIAAWNTRAKPAAQNDEAKAALDEFIYACEKGMEIRKLTKFCRSQISQALQQTPPDGYVLVPVEPTSEMIIAADEKAFGKSCDHIYKAMIAAATKEIPAKEGE